MSWATLEKITTARTKNQNCGRVAPREDVPVAQAEVDGVHVGREFFIFVHIGTYFISFALECGTSADRRRRLGAGRHLILARTAVTPSTLRSAITTVDPIGTATVPRSSVCPLFRCPHR